MGDFENLQQIKKTDYLENIENTELYNSKLEISNEIILKNFLNLTKTYEKYISKRKKQTTIHL